MSVCALCICMMCAFVCLGDMRVFCCCECCVGACIAGVHVLYKTEPCATRCLVVGVLLSLCVLCCDCVSCVIANYVADGCAMCVCVYDV